MVELPDWVLAITLFAGGVAVGLLVAASTGFFGAALYSAVLGSLAALAALRRRLPAEVGRLAFVGIGMMILGLILWEYRVNPASWVGFGLTALLSVIFALRRRIPRDVFILVGLVLGVMLLSFILAGAREEIRWFLASAGQLLIATATGVWDWVASFTRLEWFVVVGIWLVLRRLRMIHLVLSQRCK